MTEENKKIILIIEDDVPLQKAYEAALTKSGYEVVFASTGAEGLQKVRIQNPQLIILDLMLPGGMNGFDVLEEIKKDQNLAKIPLFVLSNLDNEESTALKIGASKYFVKSNVSIDKIISEINNAIT